MIQDMENKMVPKGTVDLVGLGRLGIRTGINLIQVHRGGPSKITVFDNQKISGSDVIFTMFGAKEEEYKTEFFKRLCTHSKDYREVVAINENISSNNLDLITGDVVVVEIAGGNTIPTAASIIKRAHELGSKTISTAGIFGIGDNDVVAKDISEFDDSNPAVQELRKEGIVKNHLIVTTNTFIRDFVPVTPYVLDDVAKVISREILRYLMEL